MTAASQYIFQKNKICHIYSQYILSLQLNFLIFWDTSFIKTEMKKYFRSYWNDKNAIFKLNGFIICKIYYIFKWRCEHINSILITLFWKLWLRWVCFPDILIIQSMILYIHLQAHIHWYMGIPISSPGHSFLLLLSLYVLIYVSTNSNIFQYLIPYNRKLHIKR